MRQSKTLLTIDERGSEIATTSVFDCQWSPGGRLMAIEKSVSNYFWSTFVDNIDFFRLPPIRCEFVVRFIILRWTFLHTIE